MFTQVPLGVLLKSETKYEDMIDIMSALQHYAPKVSYTTDEQIMSTGEDTTVGLDKIWFFSCLFCFSFVLNICPHFAFQCTHFAFYCTNFALYFSLKLAIYL